MKNTNSITISFLTNVIMFGIVGGVGFIFDVAVLYSLKGHIGLYPAKIVSFFIAVIITWLLNRVLTFKHRPSGLSLHREFTHYFVVMIAGGVINYLTFWLSTSYSSIIMAYPVIGVAIGSLCGMIFNYTSAKLLVFRSKAD